MEGFVVGEVDHFKRIVAEGGGEETFVLDVDGEMVEAAFDRREGDGCGVAEEERRFGEARDSEGEEHEDDQLEFHGLNKLINEFELLGVGLLGAI